jgi:Mn2+/Fe2+ NRAMP family transporter
MFGGSMFGLVYIIIGAVVAYAHGYVLTSVGELLSFILAVFLWPLVLLGVNVHSRCLAHEPPGAVAGCAGWRCGGR